MKTCYCHIPPDLLVKIVREKFIEKTPTLTLLQRYSGDQETEYVSTIALLDVPESEVREMLKDQPQFLAHFLDCRIHAREVLEGKLPDLKRHLRVNL
ncbi:MAG: hypothetical protein HYT76_07035 [Deltaproteobacteria bacterium]|nr:hypothetical protein [Deltaproteobacteria bacterium]